MKSQEQLAIESHSAVATQFAQRYSDLKNDPFQNCFVYSRFQLDRSLNRYLPFAGNGSADFRRRVWTWTLLGGSVRARLQGHWC